MNHAKPPFLRPCWAVFPAVLLGALPRWIVAAESPERPWFLRRAMARRRSSTLPACLLLVLLAVSLSSAAPPQRAPDALPTAQVVDSLACLHDPAQHYAFYLPSNYHPGRQWPILYAFHAGARGRVPVELYGEPAERFGYIVVGSNNSRNGPQAPVVEAVEAIWQDTHARFSIDPKRVYATGMSGGTFPAALIATTYGAGIIACGGAAKPDPSTRDAPKFAWLGVAGDADFNYIPTRDVVRVFASRGCTARLLTFDGGHVWPPKELATRAIEWLEVVAMRDGLRPRDAAFVDGYLANGVARAEAAQALVHLGDAATEYAALARELQGLTDVSTLERQARRLGATREAEREAKRDAKSTADEVARSQRLFDLLAAIEQPERLARLVGDQAPAPADVSDLGETRPSFDATTVSDRLRRELLADITGLKRDCNASERDRRLHARRILDGFHVGLQQRGRDNLTRGDPGPASIAFEVCLEILPNNAGTLYELARAQAARGRKRAALTSLRRAVNAGFAGLSRLDADAEWTALRSDEEYRALVKELREKPLPACP
jgi:poly(3-hydroxybutyrate) depolymerase